MVLLLCHALGVWCAVLMMAEIDKPVLPTPFQWEVAVVDVPAPIEAAPQARVVEPVDRESPPVETASPAVEHRVVQERLVRYREIHADYGWLSDALWRRIEELKRYPAQAKVNHWEGKVVVEAVIRDDGEVVGVSIAESSGRAVPDQEAMAVMKKVSPLALKHPLGKPASRFLSRSVTDWMGNDNKKENTYESPDDRVGDKSTVPHELREVPVERGTATVKIKFEGIKQIDLKPSGTTAPPNGTITLTAGKTGEFVLAIVGSFKGQSDFGEVELPAAELKKLTFK